MLYIFGHINKKQIRKNLDRAIWYQESLKALPLKTTNPYSYSIKVDEEKETVVITGNRNDIITGCRFLFNAYRKLKLVPEYYTFREDGTPFYSTPVPWYDTEESFIFHKEASFADCVKYFSNKANSDRVGIYRALKVHNFKPYAADINKFIEEGFIISEGMEMGYLNNLNKIIELFKSDIHVMMGVGEVVVEGLREPSLTPVGRGTFSGVLKIVEVSA